MEPGLQWQAEERKEDIGWTEKNGDWESQDVSNGKEPIPYVRNCVRVTLVGPVVA